MQIEVWDPSTGIRSARQRRLAFHVRPSIVGLVLTVLLHSLVVQSLILGTSARTVHVPQITGPGSISAPNGTDPTLTLVLAQPTDPAESSGSLFEEFASRGSAPQDQPIALISPDPSPPAFDIKDQQSTDESADTTTVASGDPTGRARLFGIYSTQIQARIERIWRRPRTPVVERTEERQSIADIDESFQCQAQVLQDAHGNVQEILLPHCNGSAEWQRSLVIAIQQASPLPAPPDPTVFSQSITVSFIGYSYEEKSNVEEYEPANRQIAKTGLAH